MTCSSQIISAILPEIHTREMWYSQTYNIFSKNLILCLFMILFAIAEVGVAPYGHCKILSPYIIHSSDYGLLLVLWDQRVYSEKSELMTA